MSNVWTSIREFASEGWGKGYSTKRVTIDRRRARQPKSRMRYKDVSQDKADVATYTPRLLAENVTPQIVRQPGASSADDIHFVLDPAAGDDELLPSLLQHLNKSTPGFRSE